MKFVPAICPVSQLKRKPFSLLTSLSLLCCLPVAGQQRAEPERYRVRGQQIRVVDLSTTANVQEIEAATEAFQQGHIVRILGGSASDLRRTVAAGAYDTADTAVNKGRTSQVVPRVAAVRLGARGELVQFIGREHLNVASTRSGAWKHSFEEWRQKQVDEAEADAPSSAWTPLIKVVSAETGRWGNSTVILQVLRANSSERDWDYYMVLTDPQVKPDFNADHCTGVSLGSCGWYTSNREISYSIDGPDKSSVLEWGPLNDITTDSGSWSIGGAINPPGPGLSFGFSQSWAQKSVTTRDHTVPGSTKASWTEQFRDIQTFSDLPETSKGTFVSHQGALFRVPTGASFKLQVEVQTSLIWRAFGLQPLQDGPIFSFARQISPPQFLVSPQTITIAPNSTAELQIVASVIDPGLGLEWKITKSPTFMTVPTKDGNGTQKLVLHLDSDAKLHDTDTLTFDTVPPYSAPSVKRGPLQVQVTVGQPDTHGVLLAGGDVGVGQSRAPTNAAALYGVEANQFVNGSLMKAPRSGHTATLLQDGTILIAGGRTPTENATATAEIFDPATMSFTELSNGLVCPGAPGCMISKGTARTALRLDNGKVFICGGTVGGVPLQTAELYDPQTRRFTAVPLMNEPRVGHTATLMWNKQVLIVGGFVDLNRDAISTRPEVYDPSTNEFTPIGNPNSPRADHTATPLANGNVLLAGGTNASHAVLDTAEWYNPSNATFQSVGKLQEARHLHSATVLDGGKVLIAGGESDSRLSESTAEIFDQVSQTFSTVLSRMTTPRSNHTATMLPNGKVFLAGGLDVGSLSSISTTEIFDPASNTFSAGPNFGGAFQHTATALRVSSTITLNSSANPSFVGQTTTLTATVNVSNPQAIQGNVSFFDQETRIGIASIINGVATLTVKLGAGTHALVARFSGDASYSPSESLLLLQKVELVASTVVLTSSLNPSSKGQEITLTAQLAASGTAEMTGTVRFLDNKELIAEAPVTTRTVQLKVPGLLSGNHPIVAVYSGDQNYTGANSAPLRQQVNGIASQVKLISAKNPAAFGDPVTFEISVTAAGAPGPAPTGQVYLLDGADPVQEGSVTLKGNGAATLVIQPLSQGPHLIKAVYTGDSYYAEGTSPVLNQMIGVVGTTTNLSFVRNPVVYGQDTEGAIISVTAKDDLKPTGTVSLKEGPNTLTTGSLDPSGQVTLTYPSGLNAGAHTLTAVYNGSAQFGASTSEPGALRVDVAPTTTVLTFAPANPNFGENLSLTATVGPERGKQTGEVVFHDGTKTVGRAQLVNGVATLQNARVSGGARSVVAVYAGDTNYSTSRSSPINIVVTPATATVILATSLNPSSKGQTVRLTATVTSSAGVPTGKVLLLDGADRIELSDLVAGVATFNISTLEVGKHSLTATYNGDGNFTAANASNTISQTVTGAAATISLLSSQNPSRAGTAVTFNVTINVTGPNPATGLLVFYDGTSQIGTAQIANNAGTFSANTLSANGLSSSTHPITAKWGGDANYEPAVSNVVNQVVDPATALTGTTLQSGKNPSAVGEQVTFQAVVVAQVGSEKKPTGTVTFKDGTSPLGNPVALSSGVATYSTSGLTAGPHSITATYDGDGNFSQSSSTILNQNVSDVAATTVTIVSSLNPSVAGSTVTFVATVRSTSGTPTGTVKFLDGTSDLGTLPLVGNTATLSVSGLGVGSHSIRADYAGDQSHAPGSSIALPQLVDRAPSTLLLSSNANPSMSAQTVTFTGSVQSPLGTRATGTVEFFDGTKSLGIAPMSNGVATFSTSSLSPGNHSITGFFSGNSNMEPDTSQIFSQAVMSPVNLVLSSSLNPSIEGQKVVFTARAIAMDGGIPTGSVTLSEGARYFGSSLLQNGVATIETTELTAGDYHLAATYGGDFRYSGATSPTVQQQVKPAQ